MATRPRIQITRRDLAVLQWVGAAGVASLDQIARWQWQGQRDTARRRLSLLRQAEYVQLHHCTVRGFAEHIYTLRPAGGERIAEHEPVIGLPRANLLAQQLALQEVYLWLEATLSAAGYTLAHWQTEYALQHQLRKGQRLAKGQRQVGEIPDGRVLFTTAAGPVQQVDIEMDGQYYGKRLQEKIATYGQQSRPVLWVCPARRVPTVAPLLAGQAHIAIIILEETPDARPYRPSAGSAGVTGWLPWADHGANLHVLRG